MRSLSFTSNTGLPIGSDAYLADEEGTLISLAILTSDKPVRALELSQEKPGIKSTAQTLCRSNLSRKRDL